MQFSLLLLYSPLSKLSTQLGQIWKIADLPSSSKADKNMYILKIDHSTNERSPKGAELSLLRPFSKIPQSGKSYLLP